MVEADGKLRIARTGAVFLTLLVAALGVYFALMVGSEPARMNEIFGIEKNLGSWEFQSAVHNLETWAGDVKYLRNGLDDPSAARAAFEGLTPRLLELIERENRAIGEAHFKHVASPADLAHDIQAKVARIESMGLATISRIEEHDRKLEIEAAAEEAADDYKGGDPAEESRLFELSKAATDARKIAAGEVASSGEAVEAAVQDGRDHFAALSRRLTNEIDLTISTLATSATTAAISIGVVGILAALIAGVGLTVAGRRVAREIFEREQANEQLQRSNIELQQFAYIASHDLQEPLRVVAGCCQILREEYGSRLDDEAKDLIRRVIGATARMQNMISDLLTYSRVETKARALEPVDTGITYGLALENLRQSIQDSQAEITRDALPMVLGDPSQLLQVFQNLLSNAIKFRGDEVPKVHVSAQPRDGQWLFSIKDNGIGIDPQYHDKVFEIFKRLQSRRRYPGTGIGLAICRRIVERLGGTIWVESRPGDGSTFHFTLNAVSDNHP